MLPVFLSLTLISSVSAATLTREATWYSESFDGGTTANGDIFDQRGYSAAICDVPLGHYLYVSKGSTGVVLDANDRPNCAKYPSVIDLSRDVFSLFAPLDRGRIADISVTDIGVAPTDVMKGFLAKDIFAHLGVTLTSSVPTVLPVGQGISIRGRVAVGSDYVIVYLAYSGGETGESSLVKVERDGSFDARISLPKQTGTYTLVLAKGKSFNTDSYATIALIDPTTLTYPSLPTEKYTLTPRIDTRSEYPSISLPDDIVGEISLRQGSTLFQTAGKALIFRDTGLTPGSTQVSISGYRLSTPSPLDWKSRIVSAYSGSVILDRTHDVIGADRVSLQIRRNTANFRFKTPIDSRIRPSYYIILPNGEVKRYTFASEYLDKENFLKPDTLIKGTFPLPTDGSYILEIVREDGIAHANIPLTRGRVWSILDPLTDEQTRTIRKDKNTVTSSTFRSINTLRMKGNRTLVSLDSTLTRLAQAKVDDMIARRYQGHADPDGYYIDRLAERLSIDPGGSIGENIGYGTVSDLTLQDGLEESGVHRYNMLEPLWTRVGIGYGIKDGKTYLVHVFGE